MRTPDPAVTRLAGRFRAAWVLRQTLAGLGAAVPPAETLQALQRQLRGAADDGDAAARAAGELDRVVAALAAADDGIPPSDFRRFLQRAARFDDAVLVSLAEAYLDPAAPATAARRDKLGFVLTRLAERSRSDGTGIDGRARMRERFAWVAAAAGAPGAPPAATEEACRRIESLRAGLEGVASLAELREKRLLARWRELKGELGALLYTPDVLAAALETNLALKGVVHALFRREEPRIFADSELVLELEADLTATSDPALADELARFHADLRRFEERLRDDSLPLDAAADLHAQALGLLQRMGETSSA